MNHEDQRMLLQRREELERLIEQNMEHLVGLRRGLRDDDPLIKQQEAKNKMLLQQLEEIKDSQHEAKPHWAITFKRKLKIPCGIYHGWQTYFVIFARPHWVAFHGLEMLCGKTNMELMGMIDALNKEKE